MLINISCVKFQKEGFVVKQVEEDSDCLIIKSTQLLVHHTGLETLKESSSSGTFDHIFLPVAPLTTEQVKIIISTLPLLHPNCIISSKTDSANVSTQINDKTVQLSLRNYRAYEKKNKTHFD
ncbi:hypothetical protein AVEN_85287-1 [Araneus ventricosus]|uniref:Uncharacterized protein n=1 Tax=Araneus ventricosus TaxID=182803 RepID=A0A4Y2Q2H8_ARAVE|nr:hypothetical protein AVEN_85287-1 [Araneus ventricosus]